MNLLDIILLILFIPAIIRGISKGFIEQIIALASLFLSAWLAYLFSNTVSGWLGQYVSNVSPQVLYVISFVVIIIVTVALLHLLARLLSNLSPFCLLLIFPMLHRLFAVPSFNPHFQNTKFHFI